MFEFRYMERDDFAEYARDLVPILYDNMEKIVPTGNNIETILPYWIQINQEKFDRRERTSILIRHKETHEVAGYFQYTIKGDVWLMEDIQFSANWKGKHNIFRNLYGFVLENLGTDIKYVEAYASKNNAKSIAVLGKLGLSPIGENIRGTSYHFRGTFEDLLKWYHKK